MTGTVGPAARVALLALLFGGGTGGLALAQVSPAVEANVLAEATTLQQSGRTAEALQTVEAFLDVQPGSTSALIMLSQIGASIGEPARVLPYAERAVTVGGPGRTAAYQIWIRALVASDRTDDARRGARAWIASDPDTPAGYSELAEVERTAGRDEDAIAVLLNGREQVGSRDLFAQGLAVLYRSRGDLPSAAAEWVTMLGWGDAGIDIVQRAIEEAEAQSDAALAALDRALDTGGAFQSRRAAVYLGNRLRRPDWALLWAQSLIEGLDPDSRVPFLRQFALDSRNRGYLENAGWSASVLADEAESPGERLQWRAMAADLAGASGDEDAARRAFESIREEAAPGTEAHRISLRRLFVLDLETDLAAAEAEIRDYAEQYPDEERDRAAMAVELSDAALATGDFGRARTALEFAPQTPGNAAIAALVERQRGLLALMEGRPESALSHLEIAAFIPTGDAGSRTDAIELVDAVSRADSAEAAALGQLLFDLRSGQASGSSRFLASLAHLPPSAARPAVMAIAARELSRTGDTDASLGLRIGIVDVYPASPEAPPALLAMARMAATADPAQATAWLERLIVDYPESAVAPLARRLLGELDGSVPSS